MKSNRSSSPSSPWEIEISRDEISSSRERARISSQITGVRRFLLENAECRVMSETTRRLFLPSISMGDGVSLSRGVSSRFPDRARENMNLREIAIESRILVYLYIYK